MDFLTVRLGASLEPHRLRMLDSDSHTSHEARALCVLEFQAIAGDTASSGDPTRSLLKR